MTHGSRVHVGNVYSRQLRDGMHVSTLEGKSLTVGIDHMNGKTTIDIIGGKPSDVANVVLKLANIKARPPRPRTHAPLRTCSPRRHRQRTVASGVLFAPCRVTVRGTTSNTCSPPPCRPATAWCT